MMVKDTETSPIAKQFVMRWGELGTKWGINRTMAQIHALLYISPEPLNAEQISESLFISRSNVSTSLRELQSWRLVKVVHLDEDRRDFFESAGDVWQLFWIVLEERKKREIDPVIDALSSCLSETPNDQDDYLRNRLTELQQFLIHMNELYEELKKIPIYRLIDFVYSAGEIKKLFDGEPEPSPIKITPVPETTAIADPEITAAIPEPLKPISEIAENKEPETVFYDGRCKACARFAERLEPLLSSKGVEFVTLQSPSGDRLHLPDEKKFSRLWILKGDQKIGGGDAVLYLAGKLPWGWPFAYLGEFHWFRRLFSKAYKHFAKHRHVIDEPSGRFF